MPCFVSRTYALTYSQSYANREIFPSSFLAREGETVEVTEYFGVGGKISGTKRVGGKFDGALSID